jgi:hypothetical protein
MTWCWCFRVTISAQLEEFNKNQYMSCSQHKRWWFGTSWTLQVFAEQRHSRNTVVSRLLFKGLKGKWINSLYLPSSAAVEVATASINVQACEHALNVSDKAYHQLIAPQVLEAF